MYFKLKEPANPRIRFRFGELILKTLPKTNSAPFILDTRGELVVAGATNSILISIAVLPLGGNKLKITGRTKVRMTEFGIQPPEFQPLGATTIRTRDEVDLEFEWVVASDIQDNPLPKILRDWQQRRERASVVRYEFAGTRLWPKGSFDFGPVDPKASISPENPEFDVTGTFDRMVLLDLARNRFRVKFDNQEYENLSRKVYRIRCVEMGDGVALRVRILENSGSPVRKNSAKSHVEFWIARGDPQLMPPGIFESDYEPLFYAAGIVPTKDVRVRPIAFIPTNDPGDFTFVVERIEGGRRYAVIREK